MIEYKGEKLKVEIGNYENMNLAIMLVTELGEPYARLTVNLEKLYGDDLVYLDTNNFPAGEEIIERYDLGKKTGKFRV